MTIKELENEIRKLSGSIDSILKATGYSDYGDIDSVEYDSTDAEELLLLDELGGIIYKLDEVKSTIDYLSLKIAETGTLHKNSNGRYELPSGREFSCGSGIEILVDDEYTDAPRWVAGAIEHNGNDYYFTARKGVVLEGATARRRERKW